MATIAELFEKEPLQLTKDERLQIVAELRASRQLWLQENSKAKARGGRTPSTGSAKAAGISLDDLHIEDV